MNYFLFSRKVNSVTKTLFENNLLVYLPFNELKFWKKINQLLSA